MSPKPLLLALLISLPAHAYDLNEAWAAARVHSAQYDAARHARNAAQEPQTQAKARLLPQVSANANYSDRAQDAYDKYQSHGWNVQISQPLYDRARWDAWRAEQITARLGDSQLDNTTSELLLDVGKACLETLTARDKLTAVAAEKNAYQLQIRQAKALFQSGEATIIDTYEAQAGYDSASAKEARLQTELAVAENRLANLTGLDPSRLESLAGKTLLDYLTVAGQKEWEEQALAHSTAVRVRTQESEKSHADIATAKSGHQPQLSLTAGYQDNRNDITYTGGNNSRSRNKGAYIGVQFTIPLYSGGEIASRVRQQEETAAQKDAELENEKASVRLQVRQAYATLRGQQAQIKAQEQLLATSDAKLESIRLGRQVGVRNNMDEIKAEQEKAQAEEQLAEARYGYIEAYLQLLHLAGKLHGEEGREAARRLYGYQ